ncbi:MAG: glutathione S-transferase [Rhodobacteraceae bacterium]|nr:glutathione S-transferase [Paracoccaceae bacterium]
MKLFFALTSPFVRKVMIVLHETGQLADVELVETLPNPVSRPDALASVNPLSKMPTLVRADGPVLYDSRVICRYLDDRAQAGLYGTGTAHWDILTLEATGDGIMDAAVAKRYEESLRPKDKRWTDWADGQWAKVTAAVRVIEMRWMAHLSRPLDIGHISVACALGYVDFRHGALDWRSGVPELAAWYADFDQRDSMRATAPPT